MKNVLFAFCVVMLGACQTTGNTKWHTVYDAGYGDNNDSSPAIITVVENTQNNNWSSNSNTNESSNGETSSPSVQEDPNSVPGPHNISEAFEGPMGTPDNPNPPVNPDCGLCN